MGVETVAIIAVSAAIAGAGVGAYSAVQQGNFQKSIAKQQAAEMELQAEQMKTQRAGEHVDESNRSLERARQLDMLFREQRVMEASSGLMGGSFNAIQAGDLSAYTREQSLANIYTSTKDSNAALQLDSMRRQIASTRASGAFAQRMGILNATGGILSTTGTVLAGYNNFKNTNPTLNKNKPIE
jgi:flagellar motility protein MotE (MotC chaperone)